MPHGILETGFRLGKYQVLAHVATGGMGVVYKARDLELGRLIALKVLQPGLAVNNQVLERFRREARHAARLNHPNIVTLYEPGYDERKDLYFLAMEFVDGIDLEDLIRRREHLPPDEARRVLIQVVRALDHAHHHSIVHRDIKPSNILLTRVGRRTMVKLADLGLARGPDDNDYRMTREGHTIGTVDYISPEQARNSHGVDCRSDIYSLGCTGFHMLTGRPPFHEGGLGERLVKHLEAPPPDVRDLNPAVSVAFALLIRKMMAKKPEERFATPYDLLVQLKRTHPWAAEEEEGTALDLEDERTTVHDAPHPSAEADKSSERSTTPLPTPVLVSPEQARAALAFHARAVKVLDDGGDLAYARQLVDSCLEQDPFHSTYIHTARTLYRKMDGGGWFGSLNVIASKSRLHLARSRGDWRKVLLLGEEVLAKRPDDLDTHLELAGAAEALGHLDLAGWYLEQAHGQVSDNPILLRAMARMHELRHRWKAALALWAKLRQLEPHDPTPSRKINEVMAQIHLDVVNHGRP